jgi:hypothetical protein
MNRVNRLRRADPNPPNFIWPPPESITTGKDATAPPSAPVPWVALDTTHSCEYLISCSRDGGRGMALTGKMRLLASTSDHPYETHPLGRTRTWERGRSSCCNSNGCLFVQILREVFSWMMHRSDGCNRFCERSGWIFRPIRN